MCTIQYRIGNCLEQAKKIKEEHPNISMVCFDLEDCSYDDMAAINDRTIQIKDGKAKLDVVYYKSDGHAVTTYITLKSKKLNVQQTVTELEE